MTSHNRQRQQLWDNLSDTENRRELATEVATTIAFQIKALREKNGWNQGELAKRTEKEQPTISQLEDPNYGRYSLSTLKKLANAFDVALIVRFVPFSELVDWLAHLTPDKLSPLSYREEQKQGQRQLERELVLTYYSSVLSQADNTQVATLPPRIPAPLSTGEQFEEEATNLAIRSQRERENIQGERVNEVAA